MNHEIVIEDAIMQSPEVLGYPDALAIRHIRFDTNKKSGKLDLLLLPSSGSRKVVLIECKRSNAPDADRKCIGQLLKYWAFALQLGDEGVTRLTNYAIHHSNDSQCTALTTPKKILNVTKEPTEDNPLRNGQKLQPEEIGLFIAIDGEPHVALKSCGACIE